MWTDAIMNGGGGSEPKFKYYTSLETTSDINKGILHTEKPIKALVCIWAFNDSLSVCYYDPNVNENKWYRRSNGESKFSEKDFNVTSSTPQGIYNISDDRKTITFQTFGTATSNVVIITLE